MKRKLRLLWHAAQRREWRAVRLILRTIALAVIWPFCPQCGQFGWFGGSRCCWPCQRHNLLKAIFDTPLEDYDAE